MKVSVYKFGTNNKSEEIAISNSVFGDAIDHDAILEVIRWQRARWRAGTADVKNRSEIQCSTKKIYRQKGTGSARHGAKSAPIFVGGGVTFGPTPRSHEFKLNKKFRKKALRSALSLVHSKNKLILVDSIALDNFSTKEFMRQLAVHNGELKALIIDSEVNEKLASSSKNIYTCKSLPAKAINVYDLMKYDTIIVTKQALTEIEGKANV